MQIILSRRQRYDLSSVFYTLEINKDDPFKWSKVFNRSRLALGLTPIMDTLTAQKKPNIVLIDDFRTKHEIEDETVDLLMTDVIKKFTQPYQFVLFQDLFEALETYKLNATQVALPDDVPLFKDIDKENWAAPENAVDIAISSLIDVQIASHVKDDKELFSKLQEALAERRKTDKSRFQLVR